MRDAVNYYLPIVQNPLDGLNGSNVGALTNVVGNGYYGYFQSVQTEGKTDNGSNDCVMEENAVGGDCRMEIEHDVKRGQTCRKRGWAYGGEGNLKKRRENELPDPPIPRSISRPSVTISKQPTHNVPDMQRCIMGHYI